MISNFISQFLWKWGGLEKLSTLSVAISTALKNWVLLNLCSGCEEWRESWNEWWGYADCKGSPIAPRVMGETRAPRLAPVLCGFCSQGGRLLARNTASTYTKKYTCNNTQSAHSVQSTQVWAFFPRVASLRTHPEAQHQVLRSTSSTLRGSLSLTSSCCFTHGLGKVLLKKTVLVFLFNK